MKSFDLQISAPIPILAACCLQLFNVCPNLSICKMYDMPTRVSTNSLVLLNCTCIIQRNVLTLLLGIRSEIPFLFQLMAGTLIDSQRGRISSNYHN